MKFAQNSRDMSLFSPDFFVLATAVADAPKSKGFLDAIQSMLATAKDPWVVVGLVGSFVFSVRFVIQWLASERAKKSVIPFGFWECSALGAILVLSSFMHQKNLNGILQNLLPLPIYIRNLYMRYTHKEPKHPGNIERPEE